MLEQKELLQPLLQAHEGTEMDGIILFHKDTFGDPPYYSVFQVWTKTYIISSQRADFFVSPKMVAQSPNSAPISHFFTLLAIL